MTGTALELSLILALIFVNGALAMSEIAVVSARKSRLLQQARSGDPRAKRAHELAEAPNRFLSTVQVGITAIAIVMGAIGGTTVARPLAEALGAVGAVARFAEPLAVAIVVVATTYFALVLGELVPKRIALTAPERVAALVARPMHLLSVAAAPVVAILSASTDAVLRLLRVRPVSEAPVTEEEISALLAQGTAAGVFHAAERNLVESVFWLADQTVGAIMTPRPKIVWLDANDPIEQNLKVTAAHKHTRFIVAENSIDNVLGMVDVKDLWAAAVAGRMPDLRSVLRKPLFVPESAGALAMLEQFRATGIHLALVLDEFGGVVGLVTLNDVLEGIAGEIETEQPAITLRADGSWLVDASLPLRELRDELGLAEALAGAAGGYRTVGGFVLSRFGRIPAAGDWFESGGYRFEVVDMDGRRVDKILIATAAPTGG
jgi:putative hemolysin